MVNKDNEFLITEIVNEDGTSMKDFPKNPLLEKWDKLYPPTRYGQPCKGPIIGYYPDNTPIPNYGCVLCAESKCRHSDSFEVPEEDKEVYEEYLNKIEEYNALHNPSISFKIRANIINLNKEVNHL